jgi:hypothetical protein
VAVRSPSPSPGQTAASLLLGVHGSSVRRQDGEVESMGCGWGVGLHRCKRRRAQQRSRSRDGVHRAQPTEWPPGPGSSAAVCGDLLGRPALAPRRTRTRRGVRSRRAATATDSAARIRSSAVSDPALHRRRPRCSRRPVDASAPREDVSRGTSLSDRTTRCDRRRRAHPFQRGADHASHNPRCSHRSIDAGAPLNDVSRGTLMPHKTSRACNHRIAGVDIDE